MTINLTPDVNKGTIKVVLSDLPEGTVTHTLNADNNSTAGWTKSHDVLDFVTSNSDPISGSRSYELTWPRYSVIVGDSGVRYSLGGLTVGAYYRVTSKVMLDNTVNSIYVGIQGKPRTGPATLRNTVQALSYAFQATATTHVLEVVTVGSGGAYLGGTVTFDDIKVVQVPFGGVTLYRTDANGSKVPVRLPKNDDLTDGSMTVTDNEAALVGQVVYQTYDNNDLLVETATTSLAAVQRPALSIPLDPTASLTLTGAVMSYEGNHTTQHTVHYVVDRSDPVVVLGKVSPREGTLVFRENSRSSIEQVVDLYRRSEIVLIRFPSDPAAYSSQADMYHVGTNLRVAPAGDPTDSGTQYWEAQVEFVEVAPPEGKQVV